MRKLFLFLSLGIFMFSCKEAKKETKQSPYQPLADQYAEFALTTDISKLTENEKKMIPLFIEVAHIMEDIFWQNAYGDKSELMQQFAQDSAALKYISINYGPWDRLNANQPFIDGFGPKPLGANFYPTDMTKEEFDALKDPRKTDWYSVIRRDTTGQLIVLSFHEAYPEEVAKASELLDQAAELAEDPGLKKYLSLRAKALLDDDYLASDLAWMDMQDNTLDFVVGPIETYEDQLYGYKAAHSGQILVKDKEWSKRLSLYAQYLPRLQENLPVPAAYKKEKANANPDMNAYDVIYYAGDCNAGSKNIAINLPNDPRVHAAKGSRKLQLKNSMQAKFDKMVVPISKLLINPEQQKHVNFDAFFENTMFHEVAHGLGVNYTIKDKQDVRSALQNYYTSIEEGKADILGLFLVTKLAEWDIIKNKDLMDNYVTFIAGIFRSTRFGAASAHGKANMMQFAHFMESGAISRDEATGYYTIDFEKMKKDIEVIAGEYITIEGDGDIETAAKLVAEKGIVTPVLQKDLDRIADANIPKDIFFKQGKEVLGL
ncbi:MULTISPECIES: dipeptidyl-peptidase 3 family protein [Odoribacteraceae]|uniref:dipeptidyl-peptidase 3 family protein n=1 Tax=Odoribacteraceae TaxID=1853231 RepID=UPI000E4B29ED|nr:MULTISPECIES: Zn-dependent hydrolase [Odoribacteraceae]MCQ4873818.1 Zn-dependent hydrolase [Butyricimonas paravirosa]RHR79660.1 Zn-dependent hydrolase [Odoribacter sp. AF15-53]